MFSYKTEDQVWMIGTKRKESSEDPCIGTMSGIVILGIKKANKTFIVFQNLSVSSIYFFDERRTYYTK